jgi:hypothetical protein
MSTANVSEISESVALIHAAADYEALRCHCLIAARSIAARLLEMEKALSRPTPKVAIVRECLNQDADELARLVTHLENLK